MRPQTDLTFFLSFFLSFFLIFLLSFFLLVFRSFASPTGNGQQAAIFSSDATGATTAPIVDALSTIVGRINLNVQCSRSPDVFPFSGRRSSAMGTMSVSEALKSFSVETVIALKESNATSKAAAAGLEATSKFLAPVSDAASPLTLVA